MAYGLLASKPWEWEEIMQRATVAEVEQMIAGALWRAAREWDRVAWQTAYWLEAQGVKRDDGEPWTAESLLGRPLVTGDPRAEARETAPAAPLSDKAQRGLAMIEEAALQRAMRRLPPAPRTH